MSALAIQMLRQHKARQNEQRLLAGRDYHDGGLVFAMPLGDPIDVSYLRRIFKDVTKQAALPAIRFHDLRHSHASLLLAQNVHPKVVSERLGRSNISITLNVSVIAMLNTFVHSGFIPTARRARLVDGHRSGRLECNCWQRIY